VVRLLEALYFPYTSPRSYDTILRSLLLYKKIGVINPKGFFLLKKMPHSIISNPIEKTVVECKKYSRDPPVFALNPAELLKNNEDLFSQSVIADMRNPTFTANAPRGSMILYANKMTREIFETFRDKIKSAQENVPLEWRYQEGPYLGTDYFVWSVSEPLAHSILLNLTLLGVNKTRTVPMTDDRLSHQAFLFKTSGVDRLYDTHVAAYKLMQLVLPDPKSLDIRKVLDFRDKHRKEMNDFWKAMATERERLANTFELGSDELYSRAVIEFQNLKNAIKSVQDTLKWSMGASIVQLILGFAGQNPSVLATAAATTTLAMIRYFDSERRANVRGLSYLLDVQEELSFARKRKQEE